MDSSGYRVVPQELTTFADYLRDKTAPQVAQASSDVHAANGFDNNAFGVFVAQIMSDPARIALSVVGDNLDKLHNEIADAAGRTRQAAAAYRDHEQNVANKLQTFHQELS